MEGKSRPSFFQGVATVVAKLFNIVRPTHAFFGEKDAQQLLIINKMVADLEYDIQIIACPIIRENNGLAISSRNSYLSNIEQETASRIYRALQEGKAMLISGERNAQKIRTKITSSKIRGKMLHIKYV